MDDEPDYVDVDQRLHTFGANFSDALRWRNGICWAWLDNAWQQVQIRGYDPLTDLAHVTCLDDKSVHIIPPDTMWDSDRETQPVSPLETYL